MAKSRRQQSLPGMEPTVPPPPSAPIKSVATASPIAAVGVPSLPPVSFSLSDAIISPVEAKPEPNLPRAEVPAASTPAALKPDIGLPQLPPAATTKAAPPAVGERTLKAAMPEKLAGTTAYILDAFSLIFQVFHALPEMTSPRGEAVGAVFGFVRDVLNLIEQKKPDFLFVAFDLPGRTFRDDLYEPYKGEREAMPEPLVPQIPKVLTVLEILGIPVLSAERFEADDIMATFARICDEERVQCFVVSSDKDCRQLISEHVKLYNVRKNQVYDEKNLLEDWGIRPDQVVDFQSLVGDKVDNVPGVPLIGPKNAQQLLAEYGTLEGVLDRAAEMKASKKRDNLISGRELALLSRQLVRLDRHVAFPLDWASGRIGGFDLSRLADLFAEYGFRSLGDRVGKLAEVSPAASSAWKHDYRTIDTSDKLAEFVADLCQQKRISFDTETTHISPRWAEIVGYSFCWQPGVAYYLPVRAPAGEPQLNPQATLEVLRPVLENPQIEKVGQNLKYDMIVLRNVGVELAGAAYDTMVASYLLDAGERNHNLDELSKRYLNHPMMPISDLIGTGKDQRRMDEVPLAQVAWYAAEDADVPLRLMPTLSARLAEDDLETLFRTVEVPLVEVLVEMEFNGIRVDIERLAELSAEYGQRLYELEGEIHEQAGRAFNIASPKQLAEILFDQLQLPILKKTKTGPSTDAEVLSQLARLHPLPAKIVEYRQFAKLKGTYVDALPAMVHPETGRVHASFNQVVAATGRLSSSDPNLQNIPIRTEAGREIRSAFLPAEGCVLLAADYSQIELRVLAHFSGDETMRASFANDEDIHARVASEVYGVALSEVTGEMRRAAKAVNFGVIYGQSPYGLATSLGIEQDEAAKFIDAYFARYAGVEKFLTKTLEEGLKNGYVKTILGRRRAIHGIRVGAGRQRNLPERTAINTVIQGSAADLIKLAMINIHRRLKDSRWNQTRMLLQIHDELVFEVPTTMLQELGSLVREEMSGVLELSVPLKVDMKSGENWAACEPW
jgi:DNA polymerase-1